jgi:hypothetical protein
MYIKSDLLIENLSLMNRSFHSVCSLFTIRAPFVTWEICDHMRDPTQIDIQCTRLVHFPHECSYQLIVHLTDNRTWPFLAKYHDATRPSALPVYRLAQEVLDKLGHQLMVMPPPAIVCECM